MLAAPPVRNLGSHESQAMDSHPNSPCQAGIPTQLFPRTLTTEQIFAKLKALLRKVAARSIGTFAQRAASHSKPQTRGMRQLLRKLRKASTENTSSFDRHVDFRNLTF